MNYKSSFTYSVSRRHLPAPPLTILHSSLSIVPKKIILVSSLYCESELGVKEVLRRGVVKSDPIRKRRDIVEHSE